MHSPAERISWFDGHRKMVEKRHGLWLLFLASLGTALSPSGALAGDGDPRVGWRGSGRPGLWTKSDLEFAPSDAAPDALEPARILDRIDGCRLPGEFERQRALLLACNDLLDHIPDVFAEIVRQTSGRIQIVLLVSSIEQCEDAKLILSSQSVRFDHVRFVELPHDTMWARDYGPVIVTTRQGQPVVVDAGYDLARPNDDRVPEELARLLNLDVVQTPMRVDGGNLLSNGEGLAITTERLWEDNVGDQAEKETQRALLRDNYGLKEILVLESLAGEPTGHVDMFATFVSPTTVVVGRYDPESDAENAAILDRNAARLADTRTARGRLRVVRIPMPSHDEESWPTYTNVIYANGVLLVPTYDDRDHAERERALSVYARLLPRWRVVGIEAGQIIQSAGALHCITMNLGPLGQLPGFPTPRTHAAPPDELVADAPTWDAILDLVTEETYRLAPIEARGTSPWGAVRVPDRDAPPAFGRRSIPDAPRTLFHTRRWPWRGVPE